MTDSVGLAVFVKTPGLSPVKTRLAATFGKTDAEKFYSLSLAAIAQCMSELQEAGLLHPYWAIAEEDALSHPLWRKHTTVLQRGESLGQRLACVFDELFQRHRLVLAIGGDSPQLSVATFRKAIRYLQAATSTAHVVGRCHDGGFYLVGSNCRIPEAIWTEVAYSDESTADELVRLLSSSGSVFELSPLSDVDTQADLSVLVQELQQAEKLNFAQEALLRWLQGMLAK